MTNTKTYNDEIIKQYLLHEIKTDEELESIEESLFLDDEFYDRVQVIEMEMIDAYIEKKLSTQERTRFERGYLTSTERKRKVEDAMVMLKYAESETAKADEPAIVPVVSKPTEEKSFFQFIKSFFSSPTLALQYGMAAALIVLTLGGAWLLYDGISLRRELNQARNEENTRAKELEEKLKQKEQELSQQGANNEKEKEALRKEIEELQKQINNFPQIQQSTIIAAVIFPVNRGGGGAPKTIQITSNTKTVQLKISLEGETAKSYQVIVRAKGSNEIFNRKNIKPQGKFISIPLTANKLSTQTYEIIVRGDPAEDFPGATGYEFNIIRK